MVSLGQGFSTHYAVYLRLFVCTLQIRTVSTSRGQSQFDVSLQTFKFYVEVFSSFWSPDRCQGICYCQFFERCCQCESTELGYGKVVRKVPSSGSISFWSESVLSRVSSSVMVQLVTAKRKTFGIWRSKAHCRTSERMIWTEIGKYVPAVVFLRITGSFLTSNRVVFPMDQLH